MRRTDFCSILMIAATAGGLAGCKGAREGPKAAATAAPALSSAAPTPPRVVSATPASGGDLLRAFSAAFGQPAPYRVTDKDGSVLEYTPEAFIDVEPGVVALVSKGEEPDGCHACTGTIALHYLRRKADGFEVLGSWPQAGGGADWGKAAPWKLRTDIDDYPVMATEASDMGQGCQVSTVDLIELTPTGPKTVAQNVLTAVDNEREGDVADRDLVSYEGEIRPIARGKSFEVILKETDGDKTVRTVYTKAGDAFERDGAALPTC